MRDDQGSSAMRDATFSRRDVLWAGAALTVGAAFAEPPEVAAAEPSGAGSEPASWVDSAMPEVTHRMIETNGIRLHVSEQGEGPLIILCHDFGAAIAWQTALLRPDIFRAVIALSPAFRSRGFGYSGPPTTLMPRTENAVFYQLFLQTPEAEAGLGRDLRLTFRYQFYTFSGDRPPSAGVGGLPPGMMPRKGGFLTDPPSLPAWVTESDIDVYVKEYARSGFHGPLAWWRNIDRGWELMAPFAGAAVAV